MKLSNIAQRGALEEKLDAFIRRLDIERLVSIGSSHGQMSREACAALLETYLSEAAIGLRLIEPLLQQRLRILEVGSGIGLLTAFLTSEGYSIVGIEPGPAGGFGFMPSLMEAIRSQLAGSEHPTILPLGAEDLTAKDHGMFDVIFSVNVLEHIMALPEAVAAMAAVLAYDGKMRHLCANYNFPYEPHLGIPLVPVLPGLTRYVFPRPIKRNERIWSTLNFITATRIKRLAAATGLAVELQRGVMSMFFDRLQGDQVFAERHRRGLIGWLRQSSTVSKAARGIFEHVPRWLASPMIISMQHDRS
jgi:SAM-dependent methyltransferase